MNKKTTISRLLASSSRFAVVLLALLLTVSAVSCQTMDNNDEDSDKPLIYTSFFPIYSFADYLIEDEAVIRNLLPAGGTVHDWEPDPKTTADLESADLVILNGLGMESWADKLAPQLEPAGVSLIRLGDLISSADHDHDHDHVESDEDQAALDLLEILHGYHDHDHATDPHIWLDPLMAAEQVEVLAEELSLLFPDNADRYEERSKTFRDEATALDETLHAELDDHERSVFVVTHEAFSYLANSYGLIQIGITGIMREQEPDPQAMAHIIDYVRDNDIPTIYRDAYGSSKIADAVAAETDAKIEILYTMETVSDDDYSGENTYFDLMRRNLEALNKR